MNFFSAPSAERAAKLTYSDVLGLRGGDTPEWSKLRAMQTEAFGDVTFLRAYTQALLAVFVVQVYHQSVHIVVLVAWALAVVSLHAHRAIVDRAVRGRLKNGISRQDFLYHASTSLFAGLLWGGAVLGFGPLASLSELCSLLIAIAILASGQIFFRTAAPIGAVLFTATAGFCTLLYFALNALWLPMVAVFAFSASTILGALQTGRTYLMGRLTDDAMAEKEEVVSLLLREFEENEADWLWEVDTARRLRGVSPRFAFALGREQAEVDGKPLLDFVTHKKWDEGQYPSSLHQLADKLKNRENFSNLMVQVSIRGEERWWELSGTPLRDERGKFSGFRGVGSDVTEQRQSDEKIAYLARYDTLTSLPNRLMLTEALGDALRYAQQWRARCALLMVDLDRFKAVNDSLGHMTGDKLLAQVSARLQSLMDDNTLCGRLGGDEFALVMRDVSNNFAVSHLARRVIDILSEPYQVDNHTLYVGASVGSAFGPRDGTTVEELMRNADLALYSAKDTGGGEHCQFEPMLHATAEERRTLELSLRKALSRDELVLHYQPVVDARSENIVSFEALVRWNSGDHGFVSPGKFIPIAEDTRLIVPIGAWVMHQACMEARNWPAHIKINVNVSPEQLLEPDFHQVVLDALSASGLKPERLEVEVTESIFVRDAGVARSALEQLLALGCSVALDDFGTGYSSLGYLRSLRFSTIKVDRLFVQGAAQGAKESLAIINAVVAMAKSMDMTTTAEGVEDAEEAELIRNLGCDKIQGFYFGRPMSNIEALRLFKGKRARVA